MQRNGRPFAQAQAHTQAPSVVAVRVVASGPQCALAACVQTTRVAVLRSYRLARTGGTWTGPHNDHPPVAPLFLPEVARVSDVSGRCLISPSVRSVRSRNMSHEYYHGRRRLSSTSSVPMTYERPMGVGSVIHSADPAPSPVFHSFFASHDLGREPVMASGDAGWYWPSTPHEMPDYGQESAHYQTTAQSFHATAFPSAEHYGQARMEQLARDECNLSPAYSRPDEHFTCPRSYPHDYNMTPPDTFYASSTSEAYPPLSYLMDPEKHRSYVGLPSPRTVKHETFDQGDREATARATPVQAGDFDVALSPGSYVSTGVAGELLGSEMDAASGEGQDFAGTHEDETDAEENEPYAKLIHRALMSAPGHRMVLKEIYDWFALHTDKNKNPTQKGWQNSIRHNLSMNGVRDTASMRRARGAGLTDSRPSRRWSRIRPARTPRRDSSGCSSRRPSERESSRRRATERAGRTKRSASPATPPCSDRPRAAREDRRRGEASTPRQNARGSGPPP